MFCLECGKDALHALMYPVLFFVFGILISYAYYEFKEHNKKLQDT